MVIERVMGDYGRRGRQPSSGVTGFFYFPMKLIKGCRAREFNYFFNCASIVTVSFAGWVTVALDLGETRGLPRVQI